MFLFISFIHWLYCFLLFINCIHPNSYQTTLWVSKYQNKLSLPYIFRTNSHIFKYRTKECLRWFSHNFCLNVCGKLQNKYKRPISNMANQRSISTEGVVVCTIKNLPFIKKQKYFRNLAFLMQMFSFKDFKRFFSRPLLYFYCLYYLL